MISITTVPDSEPVDSHRMLFLKARFKLIKNSASVGPGLSPGSIPNGLKTGMAGTKQ